jgi:hypothetical protein
MLAPENKPLAHELREMPAYLLAFARNPIAAVRAEPLWSWPALISLQTGTAIVSGALLGILGRNIWDFLIGLFIFPLIILGTSLIVAFFLRHIFQVLKNTYIDFQKLYGILVIANLPYLFFHCFSSLLPPIDLIGFAGTCLLLIVGLVEQFRLSRSFVLSLVATLYGIFFCAWIVAQIRINRESNIHGEFQTPRSIQQLQGEVKTPED